MAKQTGPSRHHKLSRRQFLATMLSSAAVATLAAACSNQPPQTSAPPAAGSAPTGVAAAPTAATSAPTAPAAGTPRKGGEIVVGSIQEPSLFNPWIAGGGGVAAEIFNLVLEPLTRVRPDGVHMPALAVETPSRENGGISADFTTYTYKLRNDVKWHDGTPFTADDVLYTWQAVSDPKTKVTSRLNFDIVESATVKDRYSIEFKLKEPNGTFLETWGYRGILPKHVLEGQDINTADYNLAPTVGTGPFKFVSWTKGDRVIVERNPNYFQEGPYLDRIVYRIIPNSDTLLTLLETGEIDMRFVMTAEHVPIVRGLADYEVFAAPSHSYFHFTINNTDPILGDKTVRQALTRGLNKDQIVQTVLLNLVETHWSPVARPSWAFIDPPNKLTYDVEQAKQLLERVGWTVGADGVREKDGKRLSLELINISGDSERLQVVQLAQAQWKEIGVEVTIKPVDLATFQKLMVSGYQFAYGFWSFTVDPSSYNTQWTTTGTGTVNWLRYKNETVEQVLFEGLKTTDRNERLKHYKVFQEQVIEDATNIFLYNRVFFEAVKKRVKGFIPNPTTSSNMWNAREWWVEG